jgi:hypothetical protein
MSKRRARQRMVNCCAAVVSDRSGPSPQTGHRDTQEHYHACHPEDPGRCRERTHDDSPMPSENSLRPSSGPSIAGPGRSTRRSIGCPSRSGPCRRIARIKGVDQIASAVVETIGVSKRASGVAALRRLLNAKPSRRGRPRRSVLYTARRSLTLRHRLRSGDRRNLTTGPTRGLPVSDLIPSVSDQGQDDDQPVEELDVESAQARADDPGLDERDD